MAKIYFCLIIASLLFLFSCQKEKQTISVPTKTKTSSTQVTKKDINTMTKKITFIPSLEDLSPKGFNWVHFEFSSFYFGAIYEHGLKGRYRENVLKKRQKDLENYLHSLSEVKKEDFMTWDQKHQIPFLINLYHASLINQMISLDFKNLDKKIYRHKNAIIAFNQSYSLESFIQNEILKIAKDPNIAFTLKCFEENCPEFRNTIYNYKNVDSLVKQSAIRYFFDEDKKIVQKGKIKLPYIQSLFAPLFPKTQKDFKAYIMDTMAGVKYNDSKFLHINTNENMSF